MRNKIHFLRTCSHYSNLANRTFIRASSRRLGHSQVPRHEPIFPAFSVTPSHLQDVEHLDQLLTVVGDIQKSLAFVAVDQRPPFTPDEYTTWSPIAQQPLLQTAIQYLFSMLDSGNSKDVALFDLASIARMQLDSVPPDWLIMYLVHTKTNTPEDANLAAALVLKVIPKTLPESQHNLLILSVRALAKHDITQPLRWILKTFYKLPIAREPVTQFNLLLLAMSRFPPSAEVHNAIIAILTEMQNRKIRILSRTYTALIPMGADSYDIAAFLRFRMKEENFIPTLQHLQAFLNVFSKYSSHFATEYSESIQAVRSKLKYNLPVKWKKYTQSHRFERWRTDHLRSFQRFNSRVVRFLGASGIGAELEHDEANELLMRKQLPVLSAHDRLRVDAFRRNVATFLSIVGRDKRIPKETILELWEKTKKYRALDAAAYTAVMQALVDRYDCQAALDVWEDFTKSSKRIDPHCLSIAFRVLIGNGRALEAFDLLHTLVFPVGHPMHPGDANVPRPKGSITPSTTLINSFMSALHVFGDRPELVFRVWDCMEEVYNVRRDSVTLAILIKAARFASRLDASFRGMQMQLQYANPFRRSRHEEGDKPQAVQQISELRELLKPGAEKLPRTSLWGTVPAVPKVRQLFRQIMYENWPFLRQVQSPAQAVWSDHTESRSPVSNFLKEIIKTPFVYSTSTPSGPVAIPPTGTVPLGVPGMTNVGPYASIRPDDKCFRAYIELLGLKEYSSEIPLALAWARALDIKPSRETITMSVIFWADVSHRGPLLEESGSESQYKKFLSWIDDWVGSKGSPRSSHIRYMLMKIKRMKEHRTSRFVDKRSKR